MNRTEHPITQAHARWVYSQPEIGLHCSYTSANEETERKARHSLTAASTCREGIIHDLRNKFQKDFCTKSKIGPNSWDIGFTRKRGIILGRTEDLAPGKNYLRIMTHTYLPTLPEAPVYTQVMNTILGIVCVLLDPNRPTGDWWESPGEDIYTEVDHAGYKRAHAYWYGAGNFCLQHPVLVSIVTGLYRQAALLCNAGLAQDIINTVDQERVRETITDCNWREALAIAMDIRPWIEVPVAKPGNAINYSFPLGYWTRFMRLQRGARRHGYESLFEQDFITGWGLEAKSDQWTGLYGFWGEKGNLTDHHRRLMSLGKPLKRRKNGPKPAQKASRR